LRFFPRKNARDQRDFVVLTKRREQMKHKLPSRMGYTGIRKEGGYEQYIHRIRLIIQRRFLGGQQTPPEDCPEYLGEHPLQFCLLCKGPRNL